jgi:hypothetical protein
MAMDDAVDQENAFEFVVRRFDGIYLKFDITAENWMPAIAQVFCKGGGETFLNNHSLGIYTTFREILKMPSWRQAYARYPVRKDATIELRAVPRDVVQRATRGQLGFLEGKLAEMVQQNLNLMDPTENSHSAT